MRNILALLSSFVSNICAIVHRSHTLSTPSGESRRQSSLFRMAVLGWSSVFERSLHMRCPLFLPYENNDSTQILTRLPLFLHHTERPSLPSTWSTPSSAPAALSTVSVPKRLHHVDESSSFTILTTTSYWFYDCCFPCFAESLTGPCYDSSFSVIGRL